MSCVPEDLQANGRFLAREGLILAGTEVLAELYSDLTLLKQDGDSCADGEVIATVRGPARLLLTRERVALNFLQRLSGVATLARRYADAVKGTRLPHPGHPQDDSRYAGPRKARRGGGRRDQSPARCSRKSSATIAIVALARSTIGCPLRA